MGRRIETVSSTIQPSCTSYVVTGDSYNKLSTNKRAGVLKMEREYYPKGKYQMHDNRVPGPGTCISFYS